VCNNYGFNFVKTIFLHCSCIAVHYKTADNDSGDDNHNANGVGDDDDVLDYQLRGVRR